MSQRVRSWCLAGLSTLAIAALAASIVWPPPGGEDDWPWALGMMAFPVSAALILAKRPGNTIGRILGVVALASLSIFGTSLYVGSYPTGQLSLWAEVLNVISVVPLFGGLIVLLYIYPTGEPVNRIFRRVLVVFVVVISLTSLVTLLAPGPLVYTQRENPAGMLPEWTRPLVDAGGVWDGAFVVFILLGLASLVVRWHRADNTERAQLRWFAMASVVAVVTLFLLTDDQGETAGAALDVVFGVLVAAGLFWSIPAAIVVAVTRYRLFDIDRLISRTVTYTLVAGMAGIAFATIAIGLPRLLGVPDESPPILVAGATLAAAAVFNPFRRRIQAKVDRRFNRARYDAQREVGALAERLQRDLELDDLAGAVLTVVSSTVQPTAASLWIRGRGR